MSASLKIDTAPAMKAFRAYALETNRELSAELNRRMFYIALRAFVLLAPLSISAARTKARTYLNAIKPKLLKVGARARRATKLLQRVDLIAQARRIAAGKRALTAKELAAGEGKKGVGILRRRGIQGAGYAKSAIARALQSLSKINVGRSFSQFGRAAVIRKSGKVSRPEQPPNAALVKIASEYGVPIPAGSSGNVGVFRGTKANVKGARPGINPTVEISMEGFVADAESGKMNSAFAVAFQRALNDEGGQAEAKLTEIAQQVANKYSA
jgi:hypothetical protein